MSTDAANQDALLQLIVVGQLRERRAQARSARALQTSRALDQAWHRHAQSLDGVDQAQARAKAEQARRLQAGQWAVGLQGYIDTAERRWRAEQQALRSARERWRESLGEVRRAAQAVAAAQERTQAYVELLQQWRAAQQALGDGEDDG